MNENQSNLAIIWKPGMTIWDAEKMIIKNALIYYGGNKSKAAKSLGIVRATIIKRISQFDLKEFVGDFRMKKYLENQ